MLTSGPAGNMPLFRSIAKGSGAFYTSFNYRAFSDDNFTQTSTLMKVNQNKPGPATDGTSMCLLNEKTNFPYLQLRKWMLKVVLAHGLRQHGLSF